MGRSFQCCASESDTPWSIAPSEVCYSPITMCYGDDGYDSSEENQTQVILRGSGKIGGLSVLVSANTLTTASMTIATRKNTAAGAQSVVVTAGSTGIFSDTTNVDNFADGDVYNCQITAQAGGSGTAKIRYIGVWRFDNTNHRTQYGVTNDGLVSFVASTNYFLHLAGDIGLETVENSVKSKIDIVGSFINLQVGLAVNGRSTSTVIRLRKNNANGNLVVTVTAGSTGVFEDTTHSDDVVEGDDVNYSLVTGSGTGTFGVRYIGTTKQNVNSNKSNIFSTIALGRVRGGGATLACGIAGLIQVNSLAESIVNQNLNFDFIATKLRCYISANLHITDSTLTLRKNAGNTALTMTIPALTTGIFEDTTHTVEGLGTDEMDYLWSGGTSGNATVHWIGMLIESKPTELFTGDLI